MSSLREILNEVRTEYGKLTPEVVLDVARDPEHPLHSRFEWDDDIASEKYRLWQAQKLITTVRISFVTKDGGPTEIRAYRAVRSDTADQYEYEPIEDILADPFRRKLVLNDMKRQINELIAAYEHVEEFWAYMRKVARRKKAG